MEGDNAIKSSNDENHVENHGNSGTMLHRKRFFRNFGRN